MFTTDLSLVGDGVTDSTAAIRAMLAAMPASRTTKTRLILSGVLLISDTITIPDYTILDIRGAVKLANNANVDMFRIGNGVVVGKHIDIIGGELDGNRHHQTAGLCINMWSGQDILIDGMYIHDAYEQNIRVFGGSDRITVNGNRVADGGRGNIYFQHPTVPSQPEITNSAITNNLTWYTFAAPNSANIELMNCRNLVVSNNNGWGPADFGIHAEEHVYDCILQANLMHDHAQDGMRFGYSSGNLFNGNLTSKNGYRGISLSQGSNENILTNHVANSNGWTGILLEDCSYNLVANNAALSNNTALHATYNAGIQINTLNIAAKPQYNTLRGNVTTDTQAIKTQQYGIKENGDNNLIEINDVRDNAQAPYGNIARSSWGQNKTITRNNQGAYNLCGFGVNDATPSVALDIGLFKTTNAAPTAVVMFDDGYYGQVVRVVIGDAYTTIDFTGTHLKGNGGADWLPNSGDWLEGTFDGVNWYCSVHDAT